MLLSVLLAAAVQTVPADTLFVPGFALLGEEIVAPTYHDEAPLLPERLSFSRYASMPLPYTGLPGIPLHELEPSVVVGFTRAELDEALDRLETERNNGSFPGAAVAIGRWDKTVVERGVGTMDGGLGSPPVDPDYTIYDLASLTKVIATTTAVMLLVEDGALRLDAPVSDYLPTYIGGGRELVTIRHLLSHTSGLPAWAETFGRSPQEALGRAMQARLVAAPGQRVEYSDIGFVVLWAAAEAAYKGDLTEMLDRRVFRPLEMHFTAFLPGDRCIRCAPTAVTPGFRGVVHDPIARNLGGVAGNAGLFSTAHDLARFAAMLVNGGELNGVRILKEETIQEFSRRQPGAGNRALGWETPDDSGSGAGGLRISRSAFGHTGFTGTSLWVDPDRGTWAVLLSNRTYKEGPNRMQAIRRAINDRVASAVDRTLSDR